MINITPISFGKNTGNVKTPKSQKEEAPITPTPTATPMPTEEMGEIIGFYDGPQYCGNIYRKNGHIYWDNMEAMKKANDEAAPVPPTPTPTPMPSKEMRKIIGHADGPDYCGPIYK